MKRTLFTFLILLAFATTTFAAGLLVKDQNLHIVQGPAPHGAKTLDLTSASTTVDMSSDLWWALYTPVVCYVRYMPLSTSTKASYKQSPMPSETWVGRGVNPATPFANFSGCATGTTLSTKGTLERQ
jgi:hypothetical protein